MKIIIIQRTHNMPELLTKLSEPSVKITRIPNYSKLLHYATYFGVTFEAFIQELISTTGWQFLTMFLRLSHRMLQIALFRFCGQAVRMNKLIEWITMARGVQIILFHFCRHLFIMNSIMPIKQIKQDRLLW